MVTVIVNNSAVLCTILLIVITVVHSLAVSKMSAWKEHKLRTQQYTCGEPRPKSFRVLKLFPDLEEYDPDPWETVLHRCDDSAGCCADKSSSCNVSTTENVTLVFFSVGKSMLVTRDGVNHTSCSCQPLKSAIK